MTVSQDWNSSVPVMLMVSTAVIGAPPPISGPSVVPGNSNYEYSFRVPDGATKISLIATTDVPNVPQLNPQVQAEKDKDVPGWFRVGFINGGLTYTALLQGQYTGKDGKVYRTPEFHVTVVSVLVENPPGEKPFVTDIGPVVAGPNAATGVMIDKREQAVRVLGITPGNKPTELRLGNDPAKPFVPFFIKKPGGAISYSASVQLGARIGYPSDASGINQIVVGFMQHLTVQQYTVHFGQKLSITGSLIKDTKKGALDAYHASQPWYSDYAGAYFQGGEIDQDDVDAYLASLELHDESLIDPDLEDRYFNAFNSVITDSDTPVRSFPVVWGSNATSVDIKVVFTTDVVATTKNDENTGPYFQEATAQWTMDLSGKINLADKVVWQPANIKIITFPESWGNPEPPMKSQEMTGGVLANDLKNTWTAKLSD